MNEEYLWDKSGHDPEIAEFETVLRGFAYRDTAPPAAAKAEVISFAAKPRVKAFRYAMAAAACLLFFAVSLGFWINLSRNSAINPVDDVVAQNLITIDSDDDVTFYREPFKKLDNIAAANSVPPAKKKIVPVVRKITRPIVTPAEPAITAEEQHAYEQLRLALSITSSKLKLVKEKIESHEPTAAVGDESR